MHELRPTGDGPQSTDDLVVGYVGGGSGGWAPTLMNDLAQCPDLGGEVRLYDLNYERAARNAEFGTRIQERDEAVGDWRYTPVEDLGAALDGADFVVLSTQDPPHETMVHDLDLPREYGIYQTVGDTVGPGGTMRAMRAVPQYRAVAAAVREHCPDAWVINYTNPMTVCTRTLYEEYPDINAVGLCHEVFHVQDFFADLVADHADHERPPRDEVDLDVTGINHFTWVTGARWRGRDLTDLLTDQFVGRTRLSLDNNETNADAVLTARITQYSNQPTGVSGDERATTNSVELRVRARYYDQVRDSTMVEQTFTGSAEYDPTQSGPAGAEQAARLAIERAAEDIFTTATSNW